MRSPRTTMATIDVVVVLSMLIVVSCSATGAPAGSSAGPSAGSGMATVSDAWVRAPMGDDAPGAGYLTITGGASDDALVSASSPVAGMIDIHETTAGAYGMTGMQPVDRIRIPAGATVRLDPGGHHLMLMGVTDMPEVGETVQLTLTFETAGEMTVEAEVRAG